MMLTGFMPLRIRIIGSCEHGTDLRFVAFPATEYDEVFSGGQPGQLVER
jgi:hypothetical protein